MECTPEEGWIGAGGAGAWVSFVGRREGIPAPRNPLSYYLGVLICYFSLSHELSSY